jgi:hypothetical protein
MSHPKTEDYAIEDHTFTLRHDLVFRSLSILKYLMQHDVSAAGSDSVLGKENA